MLKYLDINLPPRSNSLHVLSETKEGAFSLTLYTNFNISLSFFTRFLFLGLYNPHNTTTIHETEPTQR